MNLLLHIYEVCLGKICKVLHIDYAIHQQISGCLKKAQKMGRNPFHLEVRNFGTASQPTASKQPLWALLNSIFCNTKERPTFNSYLFLFSYSFKDCNFVFKVTFVFKLLLFFNIIIVYLDGGTLENQHSCWRAPLLKEFENQNQKINQNQRNGLMPIKSCNIINTVRYYSYSTILYLKKQLLNVLVKHSFFVSQGFSFSASEELKPSTH